MAKNITHKLLSIDLDGTLLSPLFRKVYKQDCLAIQEYMSAGGMPFINTGRTPGAIVSYLNKINKNGQHRISFISCLNGAYIKDFNDGEVINKTMSHQQAKLILDLVKTVNTKNKIYCWFYFPQDIEKNIIQSYPLPWWHAFYPYSSVLELQNENDLTCNKITILSSSRKSIRNTFKRLKEANLDKELKIIHTSPRLIEVTVMGADKGYAIKYYSKKYNIPKESICSIGDTFNDLAAFNESNLSIAIKPANELLKTHVSKVISKKIKGVSKAINENLLVEKKEG